MKRKMIVAAVIAVLVVSAFAGRAAEKESIASYTCPMHAQVQVAQAGKCPTCGMALVEAQQKAPAPAAGCCAGCGMGGLSKVAQASQPGADQSMMQRCMAMMQKAGITPEMMRHCRVMMSTPIFLDSPCAVYGQAQSLGLSEEQQKKLIEIENKARKEAVAVLTAEQRKKMGDISGKPMAMAQMCQQMCARMMPMIQKKTGGKAAGGPMMMCPMMQMMRGGTAPTASGSKPQGTGTKPEGSGSKSDR